MRARVTRWVVCGTVAAGVLVLVGAGYALKDRVIEEWHIRRLRSDDYVERFDAARNLGEMRSTRAVPGLITLLQESREHKDEARGGLGAGRESVQIRGRCARSDRAGGHRSRRAGARAE